MQKTPWQIHKERWGDCQDCSLCSRRDKVVLGRGTVPCDVLFIGEAPGPSENVTGQPFTGPSGDLLNHIVREIAEEIEIRHGDEFKYGFTNLVSCIPLDENHEKFKEPEEEHIRTCSQRLMEFIHEVAEPDLLVCVGKLPEKWVPKMMDEWSEEWSPVEVCNIVHPSYILRNVAAQSILIERSIVTVVDKIEETFYE